MKREKERDTMKVKIYFENYPTGVTTDILTGSEMKTWKMKTHDTKGTWFSYKTDKTIPEVYDVFAYHGYNLEDFVSVTFEKSKEN
jgi:hypothetical protein